jgi:hypothetical protein
MGQGGGRARGSGVSQEAHDATSVDRWVTRPGRSATIKGTEASQPTTSSRSLAGGMSSRERALALGPEEEVQG